MIVSPVGIIEYFGIVELASGIFDKAYFISLLTLAFFCFIAGQILTTIGLFNKNIIIRINIFGTTGIVSLTLGSLLMFFALPGQAWVISLLTSIPFLILSGLFLATIKKQDPHSQ